MFTQHLKKLAQPIWDAQLKHPFVEALGDGSLPKEAPSETHLYRNRLALYSSPEFAEAARWMCEKVNLWAKSADKDQKLRMESHFILISRYEWMFWEMAGREARWPV